MITIVPNTAAVHWLESDRETVEWEAMTNTMTVGAEGREIDTGKRFYLDESRTWKPWLDIQLEVLKDLALAVKAQNDLLRQIQFNTGEAIGDNHLGINV